MNGVMAEEMQGVKPDPDAPTPHADEDVFEDTGELQFPKTTQKTWLIRVPKDLWTGIERLKGDDTISLGNMYVWSMPDGSQKIRWRLDKATPDFSMIAKEYDLQVMAGVPKNTFIFSEKDLPGYRSNTTNIFGRRFPRPDALRKTEGGKIEKPRQRGPRIIPKHTEYVAAPDHEVHCTPRENDEWVSLQARKAALERAKRPETLLTVIEGRDLAMSTVASDFLRVAEAARRPKGAAAHEHKAMRLDEPVLLDILADKFRQYRFWPLKRLREETRQPEQHLKEVLSKIAVLVKTGQAANTYTLNPQMAAAIKMQDEVAGALDEAGVRQDEIAPDEWSGQDDDYDEDEDMEDVPA